MIPFQIIMLLVNYVIYKILTVILLNFYYFHFYFFKNIKLILNFKGSHCLNASYCI